MDAQPMYTSDKNIRPMTWAPNGCENVSSAQTSGKHAWSYSLTSNTAEEEQLNESQECVETIFVDDEEGSEPSMKHLISCRLVSMSLGVKVQSYLESRFHALEIEQPNG
jgi:VCBS repeat-containing protein